MCCEGLPGIGSLVRASSGRNQVPTIIIGILRPMNREVVNFLSFCTDLSDATSKAVELYRGSSEWRAHHELAA